MHVSEVNTVHVNYFIKFLQKYVPLISEMRKLKLKDFK